VSGTPLNEIRRLGREHGMVPLRVDGWAKVCAGTTTLDELLRVTSDDEAG
jgi:type II secretory ATPase GspE/PulE/Tfp pilus assembly ATPase PilB-like protein